MRQDLEAEKQRALYSDGINPPRVSSAQLGEMLSKVLAAAEEVGELAYYGIEGHSTAKSEWLAESDLAEARQWYKDVTPYNKLLQATLSPLRGSGAAGQNRWAF